MSRKWIVVSPASQGQLGTEARVWTIANIPYMMICGEADKSQDTRSLCEAGY